MFVSLKKTQRELDQLLTEAVTLTQGQQSPERTIDGAEALLVRLDTLAGQGGERLGRPRQVVTRTRAELTRLIGSAWMSRSRIPEAKQAFRHALSLWRSLGANHEISVLLNMCGALFQLAGDRETAMRFYAGAIQAGEQAGGGIILYRPYHNLGQVLVAQRQMEQARIALALAVGIAEEVRAGGTRTKTSEASAEQPMVIAGDALIVASWYHAERQRETAIHWFEKSASAALIEENPPVRAASVLALARYEIASGQVVFAEGRVAGLLKYCSDHDLSADLTRCLILLTELRLRNSREISNMRLIKQQMERICRAPDTYPQDCYKLFTITAEFCRQVLQDIPAAQRYTSIYQDLMRKRWTHR